MDRPTARQIPISVAIGNPAEDRDAAGPGCACCGRPDNPVDNGHGSWHKRDAAILEDLRRNSDRCDMCWMVSSCIESFANLQAEAGGDGQPPGRFSIHCDPSSLLWIDAPDDDDDDDDDPKRFFGNLGLEIFMEPGTEGGKSRFFGEARGG